MEKLVYLPALSFVTSANRLTWKLLSKINYDIYKTVTFDYFSNFARANIFI